MSFFGFANDFLGLFSSQALLSFDLEFDEFSMLLVWVHRLDLPSDTQRLKRLKNRVFLNLIIIQHFQAQSCRH